MTKIDIISGFLGAGKTTFIKKMLDEVFAGEKIVLIENEFGEVGIDGGFLKDAGIEITEMNSKKDDLAVEKARLTSVATAKTSTVAAAMEDATVTGYATE